MAIHWAPVESAAKAFITFTPTRITLTRAAPGFTVRSTKAASVRDDGGARRTWSRVATQEAGVLAAGVRI